MQAEVISIGDELTSGERLDTNSQWLSQQLAELGIRVLYHTTVGDDLDANVEVFQSAMNRADIIVATGGLGPTADDLTRPAMAKATGRRLELDEAALGTIEQRFARHGRKMPKQNESQAYFPVGSRIIPNPDGTAPGIDVEFSRPGRPPSRTFALPGVPAEMREMWHASVRPSIEALLGSERRVICHRVIKCFGVGESHLEEMLPDIIRRGRRPSVGITVHKATISLRITADAPSYEEAMIQMEPTVVMIRDTLGPLVFGEGDEELEHAVYRLLSQYQMSVAIGESGTLGLVAERLGSLPGVETVFRGATVVADQAEWNTADLRTPTGVEQLAEKVRCDFQSDLGLAVGRFPQEEGADDEFYLALATSQGSQSKACRFAGHPDIRRDRSAKQALDLLRTWLYDRE